MTSNLLWDGPVSRRVRLADGSVFPGHSLLANIFYIWDRHDTVSAKITKFVCDVKQYYRND